MIDRASEQHIIEALVLDGNRKAAQKHLERISSRLATEDRADLLRIVNAFPCSSDSSRVFAPLIGLLDGEDVFCELTVHDGGDLPEYFHRETRDAVVRAFHDCWKLIGGQGEPPALGIRILLAEALGIEVGGRSLYLAALLKSAAHWGQATPSRPLVATGYPDEHLDFLERKAALLEGAQDDLGTGRMLVTGVGGRSSSYSDTRILHVTPVDALQNAFDIVPWHPNAEVVQVHVYCGEHLSKPPKRFSESKTRLVALKEDLRPADLPEALDRIREAIDDFERAEFCIGGPVTLAAWLGHSLKNHQANIRCIHPKDGDKPWWHNQFAAFEAIRGQPTAEKKVIVGAPTFVPEGWEVFPLQRVSAGEVRRHIEAFLTRYGSADILHLAFATAGAFAFAVAGVLRNRLKVRFWQWNGVRYEAWFYNKGIVGGENRR